MSTLCQTEIKRNLEAFIDDFPQTSVWRAYCDLEREILIFLAGGIPTDSVFLEKYLNKAHCIANLFLSQETHHMGVIPHGEKSLKTYHMFHMNYPNSNANYQVKQNSYPTREKGKLDKM